VSTLGGELGFKETKIMLFLPQMVIKPPKRQGIDMSTVNKT
jgi:hypothetical protein